MPSVDTITPFLWFDDCAEEAMEYYVSVFPDSSIDEVMRYTEDLEDMGEQYRGMTGKINAAWFTLAGRRFGCLDGGPYFSLSEAVSFAITCVDQAEIDHYWEKLSHVPEAEQCGWCKDRFGVSWQVMPAGMDALVRTPAQMQALLGMKKIVIADLEAVQDR